MRLDTARTETISNLGGSRKFTMNATAKAFQILSSGIYERKIEAIVRELSCNAYDSHVQAGKSDVPFKVHLPTPLTPVFSVEDFGVGLSEDEVYNVYTTYFESTKTDSNEVIGALGLGSKTPFSYTDSFTVTARKDGKEVVFTASISQSGEPEVVKMYERDWLGENGVKVEVNVSQKDIPEFISCAEKVYSWFVVKPELNKNIMFDIDEDDVNNVHQYGYHLAQKDSWRSVDCKVIMGNVSYDLDLADLKADGSEPVGQFVDQLYKMKADLYFSVAIGDADVAASRETLSLDDRTKQNLLGKIENIRVNFAKNTRDKASKMNSVFEVYYNLTPFERNLVKDLDINGYTLDELLTHKYLKPDWDVWPDIDAAFYGDFNSSSRVIPRSNRQDYCDFAACMYKQTDNTYKATVVINDCERKQGLKSAVKENYSLPKNIFVVCDKNSKLTPELKKGLDQVFFGCYEVVYASSFWDGKLSSVKSSSGGLADKTIKAQRVLKGSSCFTYTKVDFTVEDANNWAYARFTSSGYHSVNIFDTYVSRPQLRKIIEALDLDGIIAYNDLNEKKIKRVIPNSLEDIIKAKVTKADCKAHVTKKALNSLVYDVKKSPMNIVNGFSGMVESIESLPSIEENLIEVCKRKLLTREEEHGIINSVRSRVGIFQTALNTFVGRSDILDSLLTNNRYDDNMISEVKDYIEFIRERKEK